MIVPMKKFFLILLEKDRAILPEQLRKLGVAHIEDLVGGGETYQNLEKENSDFEAAFYYLQNFAVAKPKKSARGAHAQIFEEEAAKRVIREVLSLKSNLDSIDERAIQLSREIDRTASLEEVSTQSLASSLEGSAYALKLYEVPLKRISGLSEEIDYIKLAAPKGKSRIAVVLHEGDAAPDIPPSFQEILPSELLPSEMRGELERTRLKREELLQRLQKEAEHLPELEEYQKAIHSLLKLEKIRSGMAVREQLSYIKGFVPTREIEKLRALATEHSWGLAFDDPGDEDFPPTLVENKPAIRIVQPVFDFLGTVPNYREYDISGWFLAFFALFFAMIFGDASYGTIIVVASLGSIFATRRKGQPTSDAQKLFLLLGSVTVVWGVLTASWFSIQFAHLPKLLQDVSLPFLNGQSPDSESNIKALCFLIGLIQLSIAHIKNIKRDFPNLKFLAQAGSLFLLAGMFNAALNLVIDAQRFPIGKWAIICIIVGFALVFVFGNWTGRLGSSLVESLKNIIPTFLGTVSVFADIVSYIRLWAVGLAGVAFSQTVNGMAGGVISGPLGFILIFALKLIIAAMLLVVAHSLNFVLTILSVIVHGIRLNMLEFSGHLGMEWSGYKYDPLREEGPSSASTQSSLQESGI